MNTNFFYNALKIGIGVIIIQSLFTCTPKQSDFQSISKEETRNVYDADGNLKSRIIIKDGKINGKAITYYPSGQISTRLNYIDNNKEGIEKKYYKSGQLYRTRPFINGKLTGIEKRFYKTGGIRTIQEFKYNNPATGLIEYNVNKDIVKYYPEIIFEIIKERDYAEQVLLLFYMSDESTNVNYYVGKLIKNKYFNTEAELELCNNGVGEIWIEPGFTGTFSISAKVVRESRGLFITQAHVWIKNGNIVNVAY